MHLLIPHATSLSLAAQGGVSGLKLPALDKLLAQLRPGLTVGSDESSLNMPHEQAIALWHGWQGADGCLPLAAQAARDDGVPLADDALGWALLTPSHWVLGRDQLQLVDPAELRLDEAQSKALFDVVRPLFDGLGWRAHWGAPLRWYAAHASLAELPSASIDRVIGRAIEPWLPARAAGAAVRRLQAETQMLLYTHPINDEREARGALPVNSFWLSGTGRPQPGRVGEELVVEECLRAPCLGNDARAWMDAWRELDATRITELASAVRRGEPVTLTLCGERRAIRYAPAEAGAWQRFTQRWRQADAAAVLETL
jgi:hypothetical protein